MPHDFLRQQTFAANSQYFNSLSFKLRTYLAPNAHPFAYIVFQFVTREPWSVDLLEGELNWKFFSSLCVLRSMDISDDIKFFEPYMGTELPSPMSNLIRGYINRRIQ
jgi:hypothetical protein